MIYKPFCLRIFKSVEFAFTLGILANARTLTFLEGNSPSPFRISRPCSRHTDAQCVSVFLNLLIYLFFD